MKKFILILGCLMIQIIAVKAFELTKILSPTGDQNIIIHDFQITTNGDIILIGDFMGTMNANVLGGENLFSSIGQMSPFIAKYDTDFNLLWFKKVVPGTEYSTATLKNIKLLDNGDCIIDYYAQRSMLFDGVEISTNTTSRIIGVMKVSSNGALLWKKIISGKKHVYGETFRYSLDKTLGMMLAAQYTDTVDVNPGNDVVEVHGVAPTFIIRLTPDGLYKSHLNLREGSDNNNQYRIDALTYQSDGSFLVAGIFKGEIDFNPNGDEVLELADINDYNTGFLAKYNSSNILQWVKHFPNASGPIEFTSVFSLGSDGILLVGEYNGEFDTDPSANTQVVTSSGKQDLFVLKLNTNGNYIWAKSIGGSENEALDQVDLVDDNLYMVGNFAGSFTIPLESGDKSLVFTNGFDPMYIKMDISNATFLDAFYVGAQGTDLYSAVEVVGNEESIYLSGMLVRQDDIDPTDGEYLLTGFYPFYRSYIIKLDAKVTGIANKKLETLYIYPNPANDILYLNGDIQKNAIVKIYSLDGKIQIQQYMNPQISISNLQSGAYIMTIESGESFYNAKFIKN